MLQLIDLDARDECMTLDYFDVQTMKLGENDFSFLPYECCDMFIAKHSGACVYECYAERLGLHWEDVCEKVLEFCSDSKDLRKSKELISCY